MTGFNERTESNPRGLVALRESRPYSFQVLHSFDPFIPTYHSIFIAVKKKEKFGLGELVGGEVVAQVTIYFLEKTVP